MLANVSELQKLYSTSDAQTYAYPFLNHLILAVCRTLVNISHVAASASTKPIRDHASPRGIKDATRQAIEKTMQVASSHMDSGEWGKQGQDAVGDILWALGNILWRLYAQVSYLLIDLKLTAAQTAHTGDGAEQDVRLAAAERKVAPRVKRIPDPENRRCGNILLARKTRCGPP